MTHLYTIIIHYASCILDTFSNDDPGYALLLPIYILSLFIIPCVSWIHIRKMTLGIHCCYPSIYYLYNIHYTSCILDTYSNDDPGYTLLLPIYLISVLAQLNRRLIGELIIYTGMQLPSSVNIFKRHFLSTHEADPFHIPHIASIGRGTRSYTYVFYSGLIRTLVALVTYSSNRLIMEIFGFFYRNVY